MKKLISIVVALMLIGGCITQQRSDDDIISHLFDEWDYTFFLEGLITSEQAVLEHLPGATVYHLDMHILDDYLHLEGHEEVLYTNEEDVPLNEVYFRLFPNIAGGSITVSSVKVNNQDVEPYYEYENSALRVPLEALQPGEKVNILMDFTVEVAQEMGGNYGLFGYFDTVLVLDEFYPVIPVYDDEGWNVEIPPPHGDVTYFDASFYLVKVTAPASLVIATSGKEIARRHEGDTQVLAFAAGPARDFYVAASENYVKVTRTVGETVINSYAFPERKERAEMALDFAENALECYSRRFGVYPYTEFDVVSTPMLAKGMEYPGIVALSQKLYDPSAVIDGFPSQVLLESVTAHEVAHQWFYNTVGNDQVDEPWLDEALAQYLTGLYYDDMYGESAAQEYRSSWDSLWGRVNREEIPIGLPSGEYESSEYSPIVYGRGPLFFMALAQEMGPAFDMVLRDYYEFHKWGIATTDTLRQRAEYCCQCDLTVLFEEWVY